jgi:uncharacterized membrane protein YgcG
VCVCLCVCVCVCFFLTYNYFLQILFIRFFTNKIKSHNEPHHITFLTVSDLDSCTSGDQLRLICMGKGVLMPDTRTLEDCEVPVFKTHPTPVNVAVRPKAKVIENSKSGGKDGSGARGGSSSGGGGSASRSTEETGQGCGCVIS